MDNHLIITFAILAAAMVVFLSNRLPADLVALLVLVALGLTGILTPQEAFSGFSRSAVITIWPFLSWPKGCGARASPSRLGICSCAWPEPANPSS